jgi:hypothetical protein
VTGSARLSISDATAWTQAFMRREWRLLLPVAFALMGLPAIVVELFAPVARTPQDIAAPLAFAIPAAIAALVGALTVSALALVPGISVAEALRLAMRRLLVMLGAMLVAGVVGGIAAVAVAVVVVAATGVTQAQTPSHAAFTASIMMLVVLALTARFCLITPIVAAEPIGPIAALRRSWVLSRGHFWRLVSLLLIVVMTSLIVSIAAQSVTGVIGWAIGRATGLDQLMAAVVAIVGALVSAVISMLFAVLTVAVYRQLAASNGN